MGNFAGKTEDKKTFITEEHKEVEKRFLLDAYNYNLPPELIAQQPISRRDNSRLMAFHRSSNTLEHASFFNLMEYLKPGDLLVVNNTKVFPARLIGKKQSGGRVEVLLLQPSLKEPKISDWFDVDDPGAKEWKGLLRTSKRPKVGQVVDFPQGLQGEVTACLDGGLWQIRFNMGGGSLLAYLEKYGLTPLPPYIKRADTVCSATAKDEDQTRYQTVFAKPVGSVAAPTAGFHFTASLYQRLEEAGISFGEITLHVGQATFLPIRTNDIRDHTIWPERFYVSEGTAGKIQKAKQEGRRVIAVGTTVVRCLESLMADRGQIGACEGWAGLYILPGHDFAVVDALITNFHLPQSSLLVLVSAFAGRERILHAYQEAIKRSYRFYSYGDCMFIQ